MNVVKSDSQVICLAQGHIYYKARTQMCNLLPTPLCFLGYQFAESHVMCTREENLHCFATTVAVIFPTVQTSRSLVHSVDLTEFN